MNFDKNITDCKDQSPRKNSYVAIDKSSENKQALSLDLKKMLEQCEQVRLHGIPQKSQAGNLENLSPSQELQDNDHDLIIVGSDVCSLYPSLDKISSAAIAREAVMNSEVKIEDVNFQAALVYILPCGGENYLKRAGLGKRIPKWTGKRGDLLKITGSSALELDRWRFMTNLTEREEKIITSMVIECTISNNYVFTCLQLCREEFLTV